MSDRARRLNPRRREPSEPSSPPPPPTKAIKREAEEVDDAEEDGAPPEFWTTALGLRPVGSSAVAPARRSPPPSAQKLNARGMPARIRKKNRLFFDDNIVNAPPPRASPKRGPKPSPLKTPVKPSPTKKPRTPRTVERKESPVPPSDPKVGQKIGIRLRNLLKLDKARRWVCFEHFYSNIDRALLGGENDFRICLKESFPKLLDRNLTRVQWTKIRRIMGKPRRCSQAFFKEEINDLHAKRQRIRIIQQRKMANLHYKDLPNEIPMQLVIGTKVTARLRLKKPHDGIFTGSIEGVDTSDNTYRITFDRPGLGTHSVPDHEVLSNDPPDTINLSAIGQKSRPRHAVQGLMSLYQNTGFSVPSVERFNSDPLLGTGPNPAKFENAVIGQFPVKFLESIVRITKILNTKKEKIAKIKELNAKAERRQSFGEKMPKNFENKYASIVIELEKMNADLQSHLSSVQDFCHDMAPGLCMAAMLAPSLLREKCRNEASAMVNKNTTDTFIGDKLKDLITDLTALLIQVKSLADTQQNAYELKVLQGTIQQMKTKLAPADQTIFQDCVEIHMQRIQASLGSSLIQF